MSLNVVEYDVIIKFQTISWSIYDVVLYFDRAAYTYLDVHLSFLYEIAENTSVKDYTEIRVGYPAGKDARIGFLTPPDGTRKFQEQQIGSNPKEAVNTFKGDISVSQMGTELGIQQVLILHNITGIKEVIIPDSPIQKGSGKVFDATGYIDVVKHIVGEASEQWNNTLVSASNYFVKTDFFLKPSDDLVLDPVARTFSGTITLPYLHKRLHIANVYAQFEGDIKPTYYKLEGVGEWSDALSPLKVHLSYNIPIGRHLTDFERKNGIRLLLTVRDKTYPSNKRGYTLISLDYGFSKGNWKSDLIYEKMWMVQPYQTASQTYPLIINAVSDPSEVKSYIYSDNLYLDQTIHWATVRSQISKILFRDFGAVIGYNYTERIEDKQHTYTNPGSLVWNGDGDNIPLVNHSDVLAIGEPVDVLDTRWCKTIEGIMFNSTLLVNM